MAVRVFIGGKEKAFTFYDAIPELDKDQLRIGFAMADRKRHLLLSDPGAGKTLTALHALMVLEEETFTTRPARVLIICPPIAVMTWVRWLHLVYSDFGFDCVIQYLDKSDRAVTPDATHVIVTYNTLSRQSAKLLERLDSFAPDVMICDESDNLTGMEAARTQVVFGDPYDFNNGLVSQIPYCWFLTGTPIPRYNDGLYPVLRAVFPDRLAEFHVKEWDNYRNAFCQTEQVMYGKMRFAQTKINGSRGNLKLKEILYGGPQPIASRVKLVLADKPQHKEITLMPKFSPEFLALEAEVLDEEGQYYAEEGEVYRIVNPKTSTAFRMMGIETAPLVADLADKELHKIRRDGVTGMLLLYLHKDVGKFLMMELRRRGWKVGRIHGATSPETAAKIESDFNRGKLDFVVGQIKSMGVALNLQQNCDFVMFAEETFSHAANLQAYQRVWRRGQKRPVKVWWCRPATELAYMKPGITERKEKSAREALD